MVKVTWREDFSGYEEMAFRVHARRNRLLGLWAAEQLGMSGDAATAYAKAVKRNPRHYNALYNLGNSLIAVDRAGRVNQSGMDSAKNSTQKRTA